MANHTMEKIDTPQALSLTDIVPVVYKLLCAWIKHSDANIWLSDSIHQTRAAALSALQTTLHLPYGWDVAETPRHGGLRGRYTR